MVCYDALQRGGLMPKLNLARAAVQDALANPFAHFEQAGFVALLAT